MQKRQLFIFSILATACISSAYSAQPINLSQQPISVLKPFLQKSVVGNTGLIQESRNMDFNQTTHVRLKQTYRGHPVWGGDVIMHIPKGGNTTLAMMSENKNATMNGLVYQDLNSDLENTPNNIFQAQQAEKALQHAVMLYRSDSNYKQEVANKKINLIVYVNEQNKAHWAYEIEFLIKPVKGMPKKPTFIIDAISFEVYQQWNNIQTIENTFAGGFGGNQKMGKLAYDGLQNNFPKLSMQRDANNNVCYLQNSDVTVKDVRKNNAVSQFPCTVIDKQHNNIYWNGELNATNGAYSPDNDALYIGEVVKGMYQNWYGIPVLTENGNPMMLNMRVHEDIENAYWDGEQMTFGDGGSMFYPLVSLGVGAHEISHGFTEQHANLQYFAQSGGLNESFSDMAAQAAEFYSVGHNSWEIGPEIVKESSGALRYMDEPTKDCNGRKPGNQCSISNVKDYHFGLNVHYSSGIFNKVFYLLGTSTGWDTRKAFDVMVQANRNYWTPLSNFNSAACGVLQAAKDYKYPVAAVTTALENVGIKTLRC